MAFTLSMLFKSDSAQAKADLRALQGEVAKTGAGAKALDTAAKAGAAGVTTLGTSADRAAADVKELAAAQTAAAQTSRTLTQANGMAAGSVGNLVAQFNDVGMMLAAGQNPLMLAVQQGSQISQVIGPMGAAGAVKALGAAFMGMLNPVNLAVMGSIAGLALVTQWLFSTGEEAESAEDKMADFADAVGRVDAVLGRVEAYDFGGKFVGMEADAAKIEARFQTILSIVRQVQAEALQSALDSIREPQGLRDAMAENRRQAEVAARYGSEQPGFEFMGLDSYYEAQMVMISLREIEGETREEILKSVEATSEKLMLLGMLTPQVQQHLAVIAEELGLQQQIAGVIETRGASEEAAAAVLGGMVSGILADLSAAAGVDLASVFGNASGPAARLLGLAGSIAGQIAAMAGAYAEYGPSGVIPGTATPRGKFSYSGMDGVARGEMKERPSPFPIGTYSVSRTSAGGGGGGGAAAERDAVAELIERLREEQQLILETDPVREELAKHRKTLAGATAAERAEIEKLIIEEQRLNAVRDVMDEIGQIGKEAFTGLVTGAHSLRDALSMVIGKLADMAASSAWDAIWGGGGGRGGGGFGGLLAGLFGGGRRSGTGTLGLPFFADGGMIYGDGGGTADKVPVMMSPGEFAVNARSTARYRPVLERINAGMDLPGFAAGGMIGGVGGPVAMAGGQGRAVPLEVHVHGAQGDKDIEERVQAGVAAGLTLYRREGFAHDFKMVQKQGGRVTG